MKFFNDKIGKKALKTVCIDLLKQLGSDVSKVKEMMRKYIKISERSKHGTRAIAILLFERQQKLDFP